MKVMFLFLITYISNAKLINLLVRKLFNEIMCIHSFIYLFIHILIHSITVFFLPDHLHPAESILVILPTIHDT